jgi:uncharacterized protein (TIGR00255 family)
MIKSMTGYGKGQASAEGLSLTVEIKSVNHRYADITVKSPRSLLFLENEIKKRVGERLRRGKIDVFINQDVLTSSLQVPVVNHPLAAAYAKVFDELRSSYGLDGGIPLGLLAGQKDVLVVREGELDEALVRGCLDSALQRALDAIEGMRAAEGAATLTDMENRLAVAEGLLAEVEQRAPAVPLEWQAKLAERLARLNGDVAADPQRLAQELAVFADRCDISEETVRFRSHLQQFRQLFRQEEAVGRQLDFLVQELNREVNTMGSKSNDADLTRLVVGLKAELEKVREQVQNVE